MNHPISSTPATQTALDRALVEKENEYLEAAEMPLYSMENPQDIAEAAADIRRRNMIFMNQNTDTLAANSFRG